MENYFNTPHAAQSAFEESLRPMPDVYELANLCIEPLNATVNLQYYEPESKKLTLFWVPTELITASALCEHGPHPNHSIQISYGMVKAIWKDALAFSLHCEFFYGESENNEQLENLIKFYMKLKRIPTVEHGFLPPPLKHTSCTEKLFGFGLSWLFSHEVAHLLQGHGAIRSNPIIYSNNLDVHDFLLHSHAPQSGHAAWLSHVTELAADYEAVHRLLEVMYVQKYIAHAKGLITERSLNEEDVWIIFSSLTLLFFRFWNQNPNDFTSEAVGSHPHPGIRCHMATRAVLSYINHPGIREQFGLTLSFNQLLELASEAFISVSLFWSTRYGYSFDELQPFMETNFHATKVAYKYLEKASSVWGEIRPAATAAHPSESQDYLLWFDDDLLKRIRENDR